jgi:hypothetical protein
MVVLGLMLTAAYAGGCSTPPEAPPRAEPSAAPRVAACYRLDPEDTTRPSNAAAGVPCSSTHTAQTFAVGTLPQSTGAGYRDAGHGRFVYPRCQRSFERFLGLDASTALRVQLSWAWFRPSERAWERGARWYRCDVVGGPADASAYAALPPSARGLFRARPPEQWLTCAQGATVPRARKVACTEPHDWRAVTTIKLGRPEDRYPGERVVQVRTRDFCSDSVGAWLGYPADFDFGYTWFHRAEWDAGNRRSVCWARTDR